MTTIKRITRNTHGGKREGSGRKKETLSITQVNAMLTSAKKYAKKHKKSIDEILLDFIYDTSKDNKIAVKNRIACIKLWKEYTIAKLQEGGETDTTLGPTIFLPKKVPLKLVK